MDSQLESVFFLFMFVYHVNTMYTVSHQEDEEDEEGEAGEARGGQEQRGEAAAPMDVVEDDENRSVVSEVQ